MTYANELNIIEGAAPTTKQQLQHPAARYLCYTVAAMPAPRWLPDGLRSLAAPAMRYGSDASGIRQRLAPPQWPHYRDGGLCGGASLWRLPRHPIRIASLARQGLGARPALSAGRYGANCIAKVARGRMLQLLLGCRRCPFNYIQLIGIGHVLLE